jgi:hypothetical protein
MTAEPLLVEPADLGGLADAVVGRTREPSRTRALGDAAARHVASRFALAERLPALRRASGVGR